MVREHVLPYTRSLVLAVGCMVVLAATTATYAWLMEPILNEIFENKDRTINHAYVVVWSRRNRIVHVISR